MSDNETLTLIVCTYRRPREVARVLRAVAAQSRVPDETLIVDGSPDDATELVVREFVREDRSGQGRVALDLKYCRVPPAERGLTRQRNYGVARARGSLVSFLDDDTVPAPDYFAETLACFARHDSACGVGGFITNEVEWRRRADADGRARSSVFRWGGWERREAYRWRLRKFLGLASESPPGWMPPAGHGRPVGYLPPDGEDYRVEFFMGCGFTFRREVFARHRFSRYFEGYGLYEDMDFCVRAARDAPLYLSTRARLAHYHAPAGRPSRFRYGRMVVLNGWFVWRRRHAHPSLSSRARWWATTALLAACQLADAARGPERRQQLTEALGRASGMATLLLSKPKEPNEPESSPEPKGSGAAEAADRVATGAGNA
ncbi:MAG TPA: glycosyltransferase [Pyrinomonadaceae bacterium]|jgi:GT2 family glycosyltransferase|nr:glycosyltransferase [Pyrinomonadaceae bacterium]